MIKAHSRLKKENEETRNAPTTCLPQKNWARLERQLSYKVSKFEKTLYDEDILKVISEEKMETRLLEDEKDSINVDSFNEFIVSIKYPYAKSIERLVHFGCKHSIGSSERFKIVYWLSLHSSRLKFQSCTFHLSCRMFDTFLLETPTQLSNPELAATAAACFLLASNTVETASDMIVPSIQQFCNAARWLDPGKILKRQLEILTHVKTSFGVCHTPHKLLHAYISRIKHHAILSRELLHLYKNGSIIQILDTSLAICDLIQYTPLPTSINGQTLISILPCFLLWAKLEPNTSLVNEPECNYLKSLFLRDICLLSNHLLCQEILDAILKIAKELVHNHDQLTKDYWHKQDRQIIRRQHPNMHIHIFPDKKDLGYN